MNPNDRCDTCLFNVDAVCTNEASRYVGSPVKAWNTCSAHSRPTPTPAELITRLTSVAAALDHLAAKAVGEYKPYFGDRARQARKWGADIREGQADLAYIAGGLQEFEAMAL